MRQDSISSNYNWSDKSTTFLKNWRTPTEDIGKTLHIAMAWTQNSAGEPYPILYKTSQDLTYVKRRMILATRKFLIECNIVIHLNKTFIQHPKQKNDVPIIHLVNTQTTQKITTNQKEKSIVFKCI